MLLNIKLCVPLCITRTRLYSFDPLKPHFYIVKLGVYRSIHYLSDFAKNLDCGYTLEPLRRGGSNEYVLSRNMKNIRFFTWIFSFFGCKIFNILNRRVFVMVIKFDLKNVCPVKTQINMFILFNPISVFC